MVKNDSIIVKIIELKCFKIKKIIVSLQSFFKQYNFSRKGYLNLIKYKQLL